MPARILLVEDDAGLTLTLEDRLSSEQYIVESARDGNAGLALALRESFNLVLLDWMLPRRSGVEVCRELRRQKITTPVLMLTARGQTADIIAGLEAGADDYLAKPFEMSELLARMAALLRRASYSPASRFDFFQSGSIVVDRRRARVTRSGKPVDLAPREYTLLCYLLDHADRALSREELLREVWSYRFIPSTRTVDVHIAALRQKLEDDPRQPKLLLTIPGEGYRFSMQKEKS